MSMTGGDALVATLLSHGIETCFGVSGESFLATLEALRRNRNSIRFVPTRHESGGAFAADAYARFTRKPGVVLVTRGPGASNAAVGLHSAAQDSIPILLIVGHVPTRAKGIEAFQEIDYHQMYGKIAKGVFEPLTAADVAACTARALRLAVAGRPGPVVLVLPRDVSDGDAGDPVIPENPGRPPAGAEPSAVARAAGMIVQAKNPVMLAGELVQWDRAHSDFRKLVEATGSSVMAAYRCQAAFPNDHPAYIGHIELSAPPYQASAWKEFDLVVAMGTRLDDATAGRHCAIRPGQKLIHIHPDPTVLARFASTLPLQSDVAPACAALLEALEGNTPPPERAAWRKPVRARHETFVAPGAAPIRGNVDIAQIVADLQDALPDDAVVVTDSGTFARWVHRYYRFNAPDSQAGSAAGSMGYGVPGAIGAALAMPGRTVVTFVGDGGFQMTGQELMTAVEHDIPIKVIVCDNGVWGSIMNSQTSKYGDEKLFGTTIRAPEFCTLAEGYGCASFKVERTADFPGAVARALAHRGPALIHVETDPRDVSPYGPWDP